MSASKSDIEKKYLKLLSQREDIEDQIDILLNPAPKARAAKKSITRRGGAAPAAAPASPKKLAIVVGHTALAPGAYAIAPIKQSEYPWNKDLAEQIVSAGTAAGITVKVFFRDKGGISGAYSAVSAWGARAAIELHFNAAGTGTARGTETLYGPNSSQAFAQAVQSSMVALYGRTGKQDRKLKKAPPYDRGRASVNALTSIPIALIEPFFGDNAADAALGQAKKSDLARALVRSFKSHFNV